MFSANHDILRVWKHIYGEQPGYLALFSGVRPLSGKFPNKNSIDRKTINSKYFRYPEEAEKAARWVNKESHDG